MVFSEVRVKPHSSQTKGMSLLVTILDRWYSINTWAICNKGKRTCHCSNRTTKVRWSQHVKDISWSKVTWNVCTEFNKLLCIVKFTWCLNLKNFRTEVGHDNLTIDWFVSIGCINIDDIWITWFLLELRNFSF